jgi:thiosulfate/3-mercaptopyruvate sulfurtransferase
MTYTTLISTHELAQHIEDPAWAIMDCRFSLTNPTRGQQDYLEAHIPGAIYVHLEKDLAAPAIPGQTGRHPLPPVDRLVDNFSRWGITTGVQVVVYDDAPGASGAIAGRLWWLLRYLGHDSIALLDGGWSRWQLENRPVRGGIEVRSKSIFTPRLHPELLASSLDVEASRLDSGSRVIDSRSSDRYRGENETIDPIAGHIPGAISAPYMENIGADGLLLPVDRLRERFGELLGSVPADKTVFYCGSGVTAALNLIALKHAGMGDARLFIGSWSEWITDPSHPIATGEA